MTDIKKLEAKLAINEHALDVALREHPDLFYKVAVELALAISNRDEAKQDLEETEAEVDMELRKDAALISVKTTEKEIESNKKADKRVKSANDRFLAERLNAARWTALKESFEQRSYALSKLVDLYLANYYSSSDSPKNLANYYSSSDSPKMSGTTTLRDIKANEVKQELAERRKRVSE
jgi:hypothetical protein